MAEGAAYVLLDIISTLLQSTVGTMADMLSLSWRLLGSLTFLSSEGGMLGIGIALAIVSIVGFMVAKFFLGSVKTIAKLFFVGLLMLAFIFLGYSLI